MSTEPKRSEAPLENMARRYPCLRDQVENVSLAGHLITTAMEAGNKLMLCGNGGSAADCEHIASELLKGFLKERPLQADEKNALTRENRTGSGKWLAENLQEGLPAIALTGHVALSTAMANDCAEALSFAQQAFALGTSGDVLMCVSTSGNAENVIAAAEMGHCKGMKIIGLTGQQGGRLNDIADLMIRVPASTTPAAQELHVPVYHALCATVEAYFFST